MSRAPKPLTPGRFHRVVAKRYLKDGFLTLDGEADIRGRSRGLLHSLDLAENLFVGWVPGPRGSGPPAGVLDNLGGLAKGFRGCLRRLRLGKRDVQLSGPTRDVLRSSGLKECEPPCGPCLNGATCINHAPGNYTCVCSQGFQVTLLPISPSWRQRIFPVGVISVIESLRKFRNSKPACSLQLH